MLICSTFSSDRMTMNDVGSLAPSNHGASDFMLNLDQLLITPASEYFAGSDINAFTPQEDGHESQH